jgi:biopolymer transport protein ExbD
LKAIAAIVAVASLTQGQAAITLNVVVAANGSIVLDGHAIKDEAELADRARDAVRKSPDVRAVIAADKAVPYGKVISVMDALKRGGVTKLSFAIAP